MFEFTAEVARKNAWPNELLAPYGGITRIRFKGSARLREHSQPSGSPALFRFQNKTGSQQVNTVDRPLDRDAHSLGFADINIIEQGTARSTSRFQRRTAT